MIEISLCMIVKNEEKILTRCLDSVADLRMQQRKLRQIIQIKYMILRGWMIFRQRGILLFLRQKKTIFTQRMRMR